MSDDSDDAHRAAATPSPLSKSAVADFDRFIEWPKPAYTRFRLGEGRGGGSGGCGNAVPPLTTPTPDPSPAEPRYSEGSATQQSDRNRQQPTSIRGRGEFAARPERKLAASDAAMPLALSEVSPGRYRGRFTLDRPGEFNLR